MKFQRLISLCCLLAFSLPYAPVRAQAAASQIDFYPSITQAWTAQTADIVGQCKVPTSMQLTAIEERIYKVGYGEGFDYGYTKCMVENSEQLAQQSLTPSNATKVFAQYKTDTFSILLPVSWTVGTRASYRQNSQELERFFANSFIHAPETALIALTPWNSIIQIIQTNSFSYHPSMAALTNDEIQSDLSLFSKLHQQDSNTETFMLTDMNFYSLQCPQATFAIQTATMQEVATNQCSYLFSASLLTGADATLSFYDFYIDFIMDDPLTDKEIAQFEDIVRSIRFCE